MGVMNQLVTGGHHLVWICVRMLATKKARPEQTWGYEAASSGGTTTWSPATFEPTGRPKQSDRPQTPAMKETKNGQFSCHWPVLQNRYGQNEVQHGTTSLKEKLENGWHNNNPAMGFSQTPSPGSVHLGSPGTSMDHFLLSFSGQVANIQTAEPIQIVVRPGALDWVPQLFCAIYELPSGNLT